MRRPSRSWKLNLMNSSQLLLVSERPDTIPCLSHTQNLILSKMFVCFFSCLSVSFPPPLLCADCPLPAVATHLTQVPSGRNSDESIAVAWFALGYSTGDIVVVEMFAGLAYAAPTPAVQTTVIKNTGLLTRLVSLPIVGPWYNADASGELSVVSGCGSLPRIGKPDKRVWEEKLFSTILISFSPPPISFVLFFQTRCLPLFVSFRLRLVCPCSL